jgi:hypothetical protein
MEETYVKNVQDMVAEVRFQMDGLNDYLAREVRINMRSFEKQAQVTAYIHIDTSGFPTNGDVDMGGT